MKKLAVIGFGVRSETLLRTYNQFDMDVSITAVYDKNPQEARKHMESAGFDIASAVFYDDVDQMLSTADVDGVVIATRCNTHTDFAVQAMKYNLPLLLEKPVAINPEQVTRLCEAGKAYQAQALVSFPLRASCLCQLAKQIVDSGELGEIQHVQAVNNVSYGRVYYKSWYRDEGITGGLFLQKATHDLDCVNYLLHGNKPVSLCAMQSKQIFKGDMAAGITCDQCEKNKTCTESTYVIRHRCLSDDPYGNGCSFAVDTGNHDSASVLIEYANGLHAVYTQNFFARKGAAKRGIRLLGYKGTLEFDWVTGECHVYNHMNDQKAVYTIDDNNLNHYGGDKLLCENFLQIMQGGESLAPLNAGILSAHMCLQAKKSAETKQFLSIEI